MIEVIVYTSLNTKLQYAKLQLMAYPLCYDTVNPSIVE